MSDTSLVPDMKEISTSTSIADEEVKKARTALRILNESVNRLMSLGFDVQIHADNGENHVRMNLKRTTKEEHKL